jgi:hypothetical protein
MPAQSRCTPSRASVSSSKGVGISVLARIGRSRRRSISANGQVPGFADVIIAATAQKRGLTVLSRDVRHFVPLGVPVLPHGNGGVDGIASGWRAAVGMEAAAA